MTVKELREILIKYDDDRQVEAMNYSEESYTDAEVEEYGKILRIIGKDYE